MTAVSFAEAKELTALADTFTPVELSLVAALVQNSRLPAAMVADALAALQFRADELGVVISPWS